MTELADGKYFYGVVTVGERGQIVIPKTARSHFGIKAGDQLMVLADVKKGIVVAPATTMRKLGLKLLGLVGEMEDLHTDEEDD